jgi:hypothetical protein
MTTIPVFKKRGVKLITEFSQPDSKKRLSLGVAMGESTAFNIYRNELGQLLLDPVKTIPVAEAWLFENSAAIASVKKGLRESASGQLHDRGSFAKFVKT